MKLVVIIPTLGRKEVVGRSLAHLEQQRRLPDEVIISAPDGRHIDLPETTGFPTRVVLGKTGLSAQRNNALADALGRFDVITFFDDDFIPADDYLERVEEGFAAHPDWAAATGRVLKDGVSTAGLSWEEGLSALHASDAEPLGEMKVIDRVGAYGCNMSIRAAVIGELRFDERLPLYGWQEDIDFTNQLWTHGRVVSVSTIRGVHLGVKGGRVSGERFGYSQVVNPIYLMKKGSMPASAALPLMFRNIVMNLTRSVWPEDYVDRRGRLRGNLLAIAHLAKGRIEPEYILRLGS